MSQQSYQDLSVWAIGMETTDRSTAKAQLRLTEEAQPQHSHILDTGNPSALNTPA